MVLLVHLHFVEVVTHNKKYPKLFGFEKKVIYIVTHKRFIKNEYSIYNYRWYR